MELDSLVLKPASISYSVCDLGNLLRVPALENVPDTRV